MATKKVAKKAAKKAPAKKAAAKKVTKKVAKKAPAKKVAAKKVAKKAPAKKVVKKVAKKAAKKAPAKLVAAKIVVPPVPVSTTRVAPKNIDTKPVVTPAAPKPAAAAKKSGGSNKVVLAVVVGILALGAIVLSKGTSTSTDTPSTTPTESATPSASASESKSSAVATTAAPLGIVAHYTATGATIFWNATTATEGLKGYTVEINSNGGAFEVAGTVGPEVTKFDVTKGDTAGWSQFRVSAIYNDGQKAEGKVFGLPGQYK